MMKRDKWESLIKIIKIVLAAAAVYLGMKYIFPVVLPFLFALLFAKLLHPLAVKIEQKTKLKRTMACALTYLIFLLIIGVIAAGLCYLCYRMGSSCIQNLGKIGDMAEEFWCLCCERVEQISGISMDGMEGKFNEKMGVFTDGAMQYSKEAGQWAFGFFAKMFVTFVSTLLILNDYTNLRKIVHQSKTGSRIREVYHDLKKAAWAYLKAQMMIFGVVIVICIGGLLLMQNKYAILAGIAIGICDTLPFIGTGTIFIPWALIDILMGNYAAAVMHIAIYLVCTFVRQILEPKLVGTKLGVHPLAVLVSLYIGIKIYGGIGVVFGPVSALILWEIWNNIKSNDLTEEQENTEEKQEA